MSNPKKQEFKHDFSGSCAPLGSQAHANFSIFSLGIFQWLPKASGKGLKKSAVKYRVRGFTSNPKPVYRRAEDVCDILDSPHGPKWLGHRKSETVR